MSVKAFIALIALYTVITGVFFIAAGVSLWQGHLFNFLCCLGSVGLAFFIFCNFILGNVCRARKGN